MVEMQPGALWTPLIPQDAGPTVPGRTAPVLRGVLRALNTTLSTAGVALMASAVVMSHRYHKGLGPAPAPSPAADGARLAVVLAPATVAASDAARAVIPAPAGGRATVSGREAAGRASAADLVAAVWATATDPDSSESVEPDEARSRLATPGTAGPRPGGRAILEASTPCPLPRGRPFLFMTYGEVDGEAGGEAGATRPRGDRGPGPAGLPVPRAARHPWFIWVVGSVGAYLASLGAVGLTSMQLHQRRKLSSYVALATLAAGAHAAASLVLFAAPGWRARLPGEASGYFRAFLRAVDADEAQAEGWAVATAVPLVLAATLGSWLLAIHARAYARWREATGEASDRTRRILESAVQRTYAGGSSSVWGRRLREKYAIGSAELECDLTSARALRTLSNGSDPMLDSSSF